MKAITINFTHIESVDLEMFGETVEVLTEVSTSSGGSETSSVGLYVDIVPPANSFSSLDIDTDSLLEAIKESLGSDDAVKELLIAWLDEMGTTAEENPTHKEMLLNVLSQMNHMVGETLGELDEIENKGSE